MPAERAQDQPSGEVLLQQRDLSFLSLFAVFCRLMYAQTLFIPAKVKQDHQQPSQKQDRWVEEGEVIVQVSLRAPSLKAKGLVWLSTEKKPLQSPSVFHYFR